MSLEIEEGFGEWGIWDAGVARGAQLTYKNTVSNVNVIRYRTALIPCECYG